VTGLRTRAYNMTAILRDPVSIKNSTWEQLSGFLMAEIHPGVLGSVCGIGFTSSDAVAFCKYVGLVTTNATFSLVSFPDLSSRVAFSTPQCVGGSPSLSDCPGVVRDPSSSCNNLNSVYLSCVRKPLPVANTASRQVFGPPTTTAAPAITVGTGTIRLVNRFDNTSMYSGRIEVLNNGVWGGICAGAITLNDAKVICRQIGGPLFSVQLVPTQSIDPPGFGAMSGPMWIDILRCTGNEPNIASCPDVELIDHTCDPAEALGLICAAQPTISLSPTPHILIGAQLALVGGGVNYGLLTVTVQGTFGTACGTAFDAADARVACRSLGMATDRAEVYAGSLDLNGFPANTPNIVGNLQCTGSESTFAFCPGFTYNPTGCTPTARISCRVPAVSPTAVATANGTVRLADGYSSSTGRVEIFNNRAWGTICLKSYVSSPHDTIHHRDQHTPLSSSSP
jgi:hypothetical protein